MMWARTERRRLITRPRMAMMTLYTTVLCLLSIAAMAQTGAYRFTMQEAETHLKDELVKQGYGESLEVDIMWRRSDDLVTGEEPIVMMIDALDVNAKDQKFKADLVFKTEEALNQPARNLGRMQVVGRYQALTEVPVLKFRLGAGEVIQEADVEYIQMAAGRLQRDSIMDAGELVGKTAVRTLSAGRPLRTAELSTPPLVSKSSVVRMTYRSDHITIEGAGTALADGAQGDRIKVRNDDSGIEVDAMVTGKGQVEVMPRMPVRIQQQASIQSAQ